MNTNFTRNLTTGMVAVMMFSSAANAEIGKWVTSKLEMLQQHADAVITGNLDNGIRYIIKPDHQAPVVSVQIWIHSGSIHEEQYLGGGIAHAVEHMIFKGSTNLAPGDVSRIISDAGGNVNAYTTFDRTVYFTDLPAREWETGFNTLAEAVFHASFPENEWQLERDVIKREIAMGEDDPGRVIGKQLWQTAFREAPFRHPVIGYTDSFSMLMRDDLVNFHKRHYHPANSTIVIAGDINPDEIVATIKSTLNPLARTPRAPVILPEEPPQTTPRYQRFEAPFDLARVARVWTVPSIPHQDTVLLEILATIIGDGRSSRLHRDLVENQQIAHSASAWYFHQGLIGLNAVCDADQADAVEAAFSATVEQVIQQGITPEELDRAVRSIMIDRLSAMTTVQGQAARYGLDAHLTGDTAYNQHYLTPLTNVTTESIQQIARQYLAPQRQTTVTMIPDAADKAIISQTTAQVAPPASLERIVLPNGITVLIREDHSLPFVYASAVLQGGRLSEPTPGTTALMADLLPRGTTTRSREQIVNAIESRGASLDPFSGYNSFGLNARFLIDDAPVMVNLLADCLLYPAFDEPEVERQRKLQLATIQHNNEQPVFLAQAQLRSKMFGDHPYAITPEGTPETLSNITPETIAAYHKRITFADNLVIALFGSISRNEAVDLVQANFANIPKGALPAIPPPPSFEIPEMIEAVREEPRSQAIIILGYPSVDIFDPKRNALELLQRSMNGLASDLALSIRDDRGLAYFTGAIQQTGLHPGWFGFYAGTRPDAINTVKALIMEQVQRLQTDGLRQDEFDRAKAQLIAAHEMQSQNQQHLAMQCAMYERYGLGADSVFSYPEQVRQLTQDEVMRAARHLFMNHAPVVSKIIPVESEVAVTP